MAVAKFSVAIPTHNRLDLLRDAVETVRRQDYQDWEVVIFDNGSDEDIAGYVRALADPRIKTKRSDAFLPVTESWNNAVAMASGDYVIVIGDDDGLIPGYFTRLSTLITAFRQPDLIYTNILQFFHPGVAPWEPRGYVADLHNAFFFERRTEPFLLSATETEKAIQGSVTLHRNFTFNMQAFCFSRWLLDELGRDGPIFRSPFPDYYLANVALGRARTSLVVPDAMAIAGVSKASYGFTLFNKDEQRGEAILNSRLQADPLFGRVRGAILPGSQYQSNYVLTMQHVVDQLQGRYRLRVDFGRYRRLQVMWAIDSFGPRKWRRPGNAGAIWDLLSPTERLTARVLSYLVRRSRKRYPKVLAALQRWIRSDAFIPDIKYAHCGDFATVVDIFEALRAGRLAAIR